MIPKETYLESFFYRTEDMLAILFPHMFEELEYLLPDPRDGIQVYRGDREAPVAGPSNARR